MVNGTLQRHLYPRLEECWERSLTDKEQQLVNILELLQIEKFIGQPTPKRCGRKLLERRAMARTFVGYLLDILQKHHKDLQEFGVQSLALLVLWSGTRPGLTVMWNPGGVCPAVGLLAFLRLKRYLEEILGRPVDLVTSKAFGPSGASAYPRGYPCRLRLAVPPGRYAQGHRNDQQFTRDLTYDRYCADTRTMKAVLYSLAVIGEAARHIPEEVRLTILKFLGEI